MTRDRLTVVHVIHDLRPGGTERRLLTLLSSLDRQRFRPVLACIDGLGELAADARAAGIEPIVLGRSRRWDPSGVVRLARVVRRERAEIVHGWLFLANVYARVGGRLGGARVVIAAEGGAEPTRSTGRRRVARATEAMLGRLTDGYIANSEATADGLRRLGAAAAKIVVVRNGTVVPPPLSVEERAQLRASVGAAEGAPLVVMVARIDPGYKDHETFLRTVAELPGITAAVVGDGPGRAAAESTAAGLGIADRVSFTGFRPDARALAAASDVCVLLTYSEGLSNSVLEAMAAAIPVITTDIPANGELIRDGVDGVLVPVRDASATAAALRRLVTHPADAARLGAAARERVAADFSPEAQAARTMEVYERLLAAKRR